GHNYLVPVGADIQREDDIATGAFDAGQLLDKMEAAHNRINIIILDACRNNPFARSFRSASQGLAQMDAPVGSYLSLATAPGRVASDGRGGNGLYTQYLLEAMNVPGLKIEDVFKRVRVKVMADSEGQQVPWDNSSLSGDFYFLPTGNVAAVGGSLTTKSEPAPEEARPKSAPQRPDEHKLTLAKASPTTVVKAERPAGEALDTLYRSGRDARSRDDVAAASIAFARAAEGGHAASEYEYGLLLKTGRKPVAQDLPHAYRLFLHAAQQGNAGGQYELAQLLSRGSGVAHDCGEAATWA